MCQGPGDAVGFIKNARSQGISEAAIKIILSNKGLSAEEISNAFAKSKGKASKVIKLSEKFSKGFDRVMKEIDGIIKKTKSRKTKEDTSPQALLDNTLPYLEGTKLYENATDLQREKMIRELRSKLGIKEKSAPSISRILGNINDVKNIIISEKELLIKRIKDIREGASTAVKAIKFLKKK